MILMLCVGWVGKMGEGAVVFVTFLLDYNCVSFKLPVRLAGVCVGGEGEEGLGGMSLCFQHHKQHARTLDTLYTPPPTHLDPEQRSVAPNFPAPQYSLPPSQNTPKTHAKITHRHTATRAAMCATGATGVIAPPLCGPAGATGGCWCGPRPPRPRRPARAGGGGVGG